MQLAGKDHDLLVADIGGTNSRFAIAGGEPGDTGLNGVTRYTNAGVVDFTAQLARYRDSLNAPLPGHACIAIAGPTDGERGSLTNGSWQFDAANLAGTFGFSKVTLINDFTALASSIHSLQTAHMQRLKPGTAVAGAPICVIGPGTGLGVACVVSPGRGQTVIPTEGGHVDLAAVTEQDWRLRQWLREQLGASVSAEHALCGEGLRRIDAFLRKDPTTLRAVDTITQEALSGEDGTGKQGVNLFLALLARFAGNAALTQGARGGVFIGGGILPRLLPILDAGQFTHNFIDKGAMADYCAALPIHVITDADASLRGAAIAFHRAGDGANR